MLFAAITANNCSDAKQKIHEAQSFPINGIELRLDYFSKFDLDEIKKLRQEFSIPMIFTLRKKSQGGFYKNTEQERLTSIKQLISLNPDYLDLEYDVPHNFIKEIHRQSPHTKLITQIPSSRGLTAGSRFPACAGNDDGQPHTKLICSYHDFNETPKDLSKILDNMQQNEFSIYKIATKANSSLDALRMLNFINEKSKELTISGMCMGELGMPTRILAPIVSSEINYASLKKEEETAPGQLDLSTLFDIYNYNKINANTHIYALLGDPVDKSRSHIFHNETFKKIYKNAVYIKIKLSAAELREFFQLIKKLPFKGFSVTMPLKEAVIPYLDKLDQDAKQIKAINTILVKDNKLFAFNTDSIGALNAIEEKIAVKGKKIIIIGAGGTAKAIAYESIKRGATVIILNRTVKRAKDLAKQLNCTGFGLDYADEIAKQGYDILVNTTSLGMEGQTQELPIPKQNILSECVVLDMVSRPRETLFIKAAQSKNCICIYGEEVFVKQAIEQQRIWSSTP